MIRLRCSLTLFVVCAGVAIMIGGCSGQNGSFSKTASDVPSQSEEAAPAHAYSEATATPLPAPSDQSSHAVQATEAATPAETNELSEFAITPAPDPASAPAERFRMPGFPPSAPRDQGTGPGLGGDKYSYIQESKFISVRDAALSTFSIDVDTASYSKTRMYLLQQRMLPPVDAVRIEELINYFEYSYAPPTNEDPFAVHVEVAQCPWKQSHLLARIGLKGREIERQRPPCNLVFLLDVSGSMDSPSKIGLVQQSMRMLTSQLSEQDRVAMVVYAGAAGLVLPSTYGDQKTEISRAIDRLQAGGSTNGGAGIQLAYQIAKQHRIAEGVNRVILCTDGDFNVGVTSPGDLVRMAESESKAGVFLSVLGFGMGNHNDAMLEELSGKANGNYAFIDSELEAHKVFVEQINSTLVTIAKDVKIQIEFNPASVASYRLIGYENRVLQARDFNDDRKDAGEIGAGHTVTALYELVPSGVEQPEQISQVDDLRYQTGKGLANEALGGELMTVKLRYKQPEGNDSRLISYAVARSDRRFTDASADFRFAASVASFGMLLRKSQYCGDANLDAVLEIASTATGEDKHGRRREFIELVTATKGLSQGIQPAASAFLNPPRVHNYPPQPYSSRPYTLTQPVVTYRYVQSPHTAWSYVAIGIVAYMLISGILVFIAIVLVCRSLRMRQAQPEVCWMPASKAK